MGTDYAEKERVFVASLEADTGRSLDAWIQAITAAGLAERNGIIDWLRQAGFTFSNASWLERIHHNGGRLVYAPEAGAAHDTPPPIPQRVPQPAQVPPPIAAILPVTTGPLRELETLHDASIGDVLAAAKGLRPLAELVLREASAAVPGLRFQADLPFVALAAPKPFACLLAGPKRLLLFANFTGGGGLDVKPATTISRAAPPYPQMLVLDDARRIDQSFREAIAAASARING